MLRKVLAFVVGGLLTLSSAVAQTQALPADQLKKIKAATVFVKVTVGRLGGGTGSGFVIHAAKDYGFIITNDHVIDSGPGEAPGALRGKPKVEVVFNSGLRDEWSSTAEVLYTNKADDLAVLKVKAIKSIPEPLAVTGADTLPETTPVYVCGFPFGEQLAGGEKNPEVSIGAASVSSNRTDADGEVAAVQLNGALNPGNSGGPVVTQDGKLVGVAVRTVAGAGIGFAVPSRLVRRAVQDVHFTPPTPTWVAGPPRKVRLETKFLDALGRMKAVTAYVAPSTGNVFKTRNADDVSKMADAKKVVPTANATTGLVVTEFAPPTTPHYWFQFVWTDPDGQTHRTRPEWLASEEAKPEPADPPPPPPLPPQPPPPPAVEFTTELPNTPGGQIDVDELNRTVGRRMGERLTVDVLTLGSCDGFGNGPSLKGYNRHKQMPPGLDFVVDAHLAERLSFARFNGEYVAARVTGTVHGPAAGMSWDVFVVEEVKLLGPDGSVLETHARKEKANLPIAQPRPAPPPLPPSLPPSVPTVGAVSELPDTPNGQIDVDQLNSTSGQRIGERLTVDILTTGSSNGFGDGPSLNGYNRRREMPQALDFVVDAALADKMKPDRLAARYVAVRLTGVVRRPTQPKKWNLFVVEEIKVLGVDGSTVATFTRGTAPEPAPAPKPSAPATPAPKPVPPTPERPKTLQPEPYPLGSAEAQAESFMQLGVVNPAVLGKRHEYSVLLAGTEPGSLLFGRTPVRSVRWSVLSPDTGQPLRNAVFYTPLTQSDQMLLAFRQIPKESKGLPCVLEFMAIQQDSRDGRGADRIDCVITSICYQNVSSRGGGRHTLRMGWDQPIRAVVATGQVSPEQIDALLQGAAPTDDRPNDWLWPAVGTSVAAALIAGGLWRALASARKPRRRAKTDRRRGRDIGDDDLDDPPTCRREG
ncbi:S1C family serine protease [Limnoglobus roseus]|uniref:Serine protease n=1 Tax=Limnoglobus roseus TaxID=2598579 RepID=A0A5C1AEF8_9BACT|nr:serine protease [Limnoglobus roseus]QEL16436.1 serine protease [Limnoglobus roseus]